VLAVLVLGIGGAVARARFDTSIRTGRDAATAFGAPVLGAVPRPRRNEKTPVVLRQNGSSRSKAFRSLAATAMASDHLPRLVFVAGPTGRAAGDVASNFAAALATLGLRVALLMTDPRQDGAYGELEPGDETSAGFDEMLNRMNGVSSNGSGEQVPAADVIHMLRRSALTPNLLVAPPGETATADLSLGGLERLLDALARSSLDIVVIAGPPFLEEPNATILAHHAGSVLWTVESGHVDQGDAEAASNRLELTGVKSFGLVLVGANE
jgi:Mrp family chromosome partitioning ATPase